MAEKIPSLKSNSVQVQRPEDALQRAIVGLLALYENMGKLTFFAIPNGGKRSKVEAAIMKGLGVRAAVPDLCILFPAGRTLWIELKADGGRVSKEQRDWIDTATAMGHQAYVCTAVEGVHAHVKAELSLAKAAA